MVTIEKRIIILEEEIEQLGEIADQLELAEKQLNGEKSLSGAEILNLTADITSATLEVNKGFVIGAGIAVVVCGTPILANYALILAVEGANKAKDFAIDAVSNGLSNATVTVKDAFWNTSWFDIGAGVTTFAAGAAVNYIIPDSVKEYSKTVTIALGTGAGYMLGHVGNKIIDAGCTTVSYIGNITLDLTKYACAEGAKELIEYKKSAIESKIKDKESKIKTWTEMIQKKQKEITR